MDASSHEIPCPVCEGAGWDWKRAADNDTQMDDPVDAYWCETCSGTGKVAAPSASCTNGVSVDH